MIKTIIFWDRDDNIKENEKQLGDKDIYEETHNDQEPLISTIQKAIKKLWWKIQSLIAFTCSQKLKNGCMMFQVGLLFQTEATRLKT